MAVQGDGHQGSVLVHNGEDRVAGLAVDALHPAHHGGLHDVIHGLLGGVGDVAVQLFELGLQIVHGAHQVGEVQVGEDVPLGHGVPFLHAQGAQGHGGGDGH